MNTPAELEERINALLTGAPYALDPERREAALLAVLKDELALACERNPRLGNYVRQWPADFRQANRVADLPYLPVGVFKADPPMALVAQSEITRTLTSSATTGQQPSRVVLDAPTSKRMTKGVTAILRDFIGASRRPFLVIDIPATLSGSGQLGARGAAIQGLRSFATEIVTCLKEEEGGLLTLEIEKLLDCAAKWKETEVLVYGFTFVLWNHLVKPLAEKGVTLDMPNVRVLHSGGWKRLQQHAVTKEAFVEGVAAAFGCAGERVIDFYGMVENVGVVYPDCEHGNKHAPAFADVIIRSPLTLEAVSPGQQGLVQVCSALPTSFPGYLVLTEDVAELIDRDGCPCGRRGPSFRFIGRAPKAEVRGCGNVETARGRAEAEGAKP
jgi:hypothetical protein